jgi:hypothetical protein
MFLVPSSLHQWLEKSSKVALTHTMEQHTFKFVNNGQWGAKLNLDVAGA